MIAPIQWQGDKVRILDQTRLPQAQVYQELKTYEAVAQAIRDMRIRGAPAIGVAAGYGIALGALDIKATGPSHYRHEFEEMLKAMADTRPTARNLFSVIERMSRVAGSAKDISQIKRDLALEAIAIHHEQEESDRTLSRLGAGLLQPGSNILTHCNTGPLATAGYGTALGIIICGYEQGKVKRVFVTETRPLCQGARLTTWELKQAGVPFTLITDSMAGHVLHGGKIDAVIVGADRIAANGDTANKIGTYTLAVLAKENNVPFYVAAPTTTIDLSTATGKDIPIEEREPEEVTCIGGVQIAPEGVEVLNPAFDVTPAQYITAIITEKGIIREPFGEGIGRLIGI